MWWSERLTSYISTEPVSQSRADEIHFRRRPRSFVVYLQLSDPFADMVGMRDSSGHTEGATHLRLTIPRCGPGQGVLLLREPTSSLTLNNGH
jgi:hypothetical protein